MDSSTTQAQSGSQNPQTASQRDMMYCHECHDEWFRDEHGLTCPECGSDFTEIIEAEHDPRADDMLMHDDENDSMPSLEDIHPHLHPLPLHNPWGDGPEREAPGIGNFRFTQTGPGSIAITSTIYRTIPAGNVGGRGSPHIHPVVDSFATMLNSIVGGARPGGRPQQNQEQGAGQGQGSSQGNQPSNPEGQATPGAQTGTGSGTTPGGHRFTYTSSARLFPRDSDHPHPQMEPVDDLHNVLMELVMGLADPVHPPPGGAGTGQGENQGQQGTQEPQRPHIHFNPIAALLSSMLPGLGGGRAGDFVYSQEALDRIISQLMEQNATGNAPGPAKQEDIKNLPKKTVDEQMLGPEGRAECSICMEEVNIGEEVTDLPCHHWFHEQCITMWLGEHDTCPHCRKGISKHDPPQNANATPGGTTNPEPSSPPYNWMPGGFGVAGSGSAEHSGVPPTGSEQRQEQNNNNDQQATQESSESSGQGGGLGERIRRNFFGSSR